MQRHHIIRVLFISFAIFLTSCNANSTKTSIETIPSNPKEDCLARGGEWTQLTRGVKGCNITYQDGKKACGDAKDCKSNVCLWFNSRQKKTASTPRCAASNIEIIHAGCTGGKIMNGRKLFLGCP